MIFVIESFFSISCLLTRFLNVKISFFSLFDKRTIIDRTSRISRFCFLRNAVINKFSFLGSNCDLVNCRVEKFCSISKNVTIGAAIHPLNFISTSPLFYREKNGLKQDWVQNLLFKDESPMTIIGNDVWIGMNATIMGGIKIGNGAVIAAHSIVTKDIPAYAIVGGVPAKLIRYRFNEETINELEKLEWWNLDQRILKDNIKLFSIEMDAELLSNLLKISQSQL